ncbi:MAG: DUF2970 domain-containing protein [Pseudomonadota bacterium]|nr:DUF2970 domain-containing protein [Pseudomonadota bacterium]
MSSKPPPSSPAAPAPEPRPDATLLQVAGAVFWSFLGIRKGTAMQRDAVTIKPQKVIIIGFVVAATLVASLLVLVRFILGHA